MEVTPTIQEAADFVAHTRASHKANVLVDAIREPASKLGGTVKTIACNDDIVYDYSNDGPIDSALDSIVDRVINVAHWHAGPCVLRIDRGDPLYLPDDRWPHDNLGSLWLASSLRGNDVAHCAMHISAMAGDWQWRSFIETSINVRTDRSAALPEWFIEAATSTETREIDGCALDEAAIAQSLRVLEDDLRRTDVQGRPVPTIRLTGALGRHERDYVVAAIGPDRWRFTTKPPEDASGISRKSLSTREMSAALATARKGDRGSLSIIVDGNRRGTIFGVGSALEALLAGKGIDLDPQCREAVSRAMHFVGCPVAQCLREILCAVNHAISEQAGKGMPALDRVSSTRMVDLEDVLRTNDKKLLYESIGQHWDEARPMGSSIGCYHGCFAVDAHGVWRDNQSRAISWDDFFDTVYLRGVKVAAKTCSQWSMHSGPEVRARRTHRDPRHAPDLAYGLCRDALAGDPRAADWLYTLAALSPTWATLTHTIDAVLTWHADGCLPDPETSARWTEPLVDWVLDLSPSDDIRQHFDAIQDDFNDVAIAKIAARGHEAPFCQKRDVDGSWALGPCACVVPPAESVSCDPCLWKTMRYRRVFYHDCGHYYYINTCLGVTTTYLTRTPLGVDGRQILAADAICPLLGKRGRGIEALVRALYTFAPLRQVIHRAQCDMAGTLDKVDSKE
jgi:hypothetical protein